MNKNQNVSMGRLSYFIGSRFLTQGRATLTHLKRLTWKASLLATVISMLAFTIALAASGDLDTTFDGDGLVITNVVPANPGRSDVTPGIAIQTDGKIIAAGYSYVPSTATEDFAVTRYNTNGSPDPAFSGDGRLITNFGGEDAAFDVVLQANGKIVVAGKTCISEICDLALARYNTNGTLDTTFSGDGKQTSDFGGNDNGSYGGLAIQPNGKIVVAGYMWNGTDYDFAIYRYLSSGTLDTTFSGDGMVKISFGAGRGEFGEDLVIQSDGKIVVVGEACDALWTNCNFAAIRLTPSGALDTTFSGDGRHTINFGANEYPLDVTLQPDGKIVLAGYKKTATAMSFALARLNTNGSLDTDFNGTGRKAFSIIVGADAGAENVIIQSDGKIVVAGFTQNGATYDFALVRLNPGGAPDSTFSGDGKVTIDFGQDETGYALALQADGKYVLGGYAYDGAQNDFALARVLP